MARPLGETSPYKADPDMKTLQTLRDEFRALTTESADLQRERLALTKRLEEVTKRIYELHGGPLSRHGGELDKARDELLREEDFALDPDRARAVFASPIEAPSLADSENGYFVVTKTTPKRFYIRESRTTHVVWYSRETGLSNCGRYRLDIAATFPDGVPDIF